MHPLHSSWKLANGILQAFLDSLGSICRRRANSGTSRWCCRKETKLVVGRQHCFVLLKGILKKDDLHELAPKAGLNSNQLNLGIWASYKNVESVYFGLVSNKEPTLQANCFTIAVATNRS
jgi:hypothetical protein